MRIFESARRHGVADDDILHALAHPLREQQLDETRVLVLGPDQAANILELILLTSHDGTEGVIHAMRATKRNLRFL